MTINVKNIMPLKNLIKGSLQINISGTADTPERKRLIEEAIEYFQKNPSPERKEYFGLKNYAGFGDQRSDHPKRYGPKHGSIVFEIDYNRDNKSLVIDEDGINYLLTTLYNPDIDLGKAISRYKNSKIDYEESLKVLNELKFENINT